MQVHRLNDEDRDWVRERTELLFGGEFVVSGQEVHDPHKLPGFVAVEGGERVGVATYSISGKSCELVTIDALCQFMGVGTELLDHVEEAAREAGCDKLWCITTNDNLDAQRFFQKRGFTISDVRIGGMTKIRLLKPSVPRYGYYGLPIRDEIHLAMKLAPLPPLSKEEGPGDKLGVDDPEGEINSFAGFYTTPAVTGGLTSRKASR